MSFLPNRRVAQDGVNPIDGDIEKIREAVRDGLITIGGWICLRCGDQSEKSERQKSGKRQSRIQGHRPVEKRHERIREEKSG